MVVLPSASLSSTLSVGSGVVDSIGGTMQLVVPSWVGCDEG